MTTATVKTTPQKKGFIGQTRKNNRAASAARTLIEFFDVVDHRQRHISKL